MIQSYDDRRRNEDAGSVGGCGKNAETADRVPVDQLMICRQEMSNKMFIIVLAGYFLFINRRRRHRKSAAAAIFIKEASSR